MTWTIQQLLDHAKHRPSGYTEEILSAAGITAPIESLSSSTTFNLQRATFNHLCAKYRPSIPTLVDLAHDYHHAVAPWRAAHYDILDEAAADARADTCALCPEFRLKDGHLTCRAYGCQPLKFWLELTPCLLQKWPEPVRAESRQNCQ